MRGNFGGVKFWRIWRLLQIRQIFPANTYKYTETTEDLPLDPPKFSSPFASTVAIHQNFTPPKFSRVRYKTIVIIIIHCYHVRRTKVLQNCKSM